MQKYIAYYRVSTKKQDYGIDAQKAAVHNYLKSRGGELVAEYSEKESGKNADRPELKKAIDECKKTGSSLTIAKLDRLSREVAFLFNLKAELDKAGVGIVCCDLPDLNTLTLGIFATMAQHERELISKRTKEGLAVAKAKGKQIGTPDPVPDWVQKMGTEARKLKKEDYYKAVTMIIKNFRKNGSTFKEIAEFLNSAGYKTSNGCMFIPQTVHRLFGSHQFEYPKSVLYQIRTMHNAGKTLTLIADELNAQGLQTVRGKSFRPSTIGYILKIFVSSNK